MVTVFGSGFFAGCEQVQDPQNAFLIGIFLNLHKYIHSYAIKIPEIACILHGRT